MFPNEHGVYSKSEGETMCLPYPKKGWRGCALAEITLLQVPDKGWLEAANYMMPLQGGGYGLSACAGYLDTREAVLDKASNYIRIAVEEIDHKDARAVNAWLDKINPQQMSLFSTLEMGVV